MISLEQLANYTALDAAFSVVMKKSKVAGVDGITPLQFAENRKRNLQEISWAIKAGVFQPDPVLQFELQKNDKSREVGILTCKDRIVARTLHKALSKVIEPFMGETCYAFRSERSALLAVQQVETVIQAGSQYVAKADVADFFSRINRELLLARIEPIIENEEVMDILKAFISAPVMVDNFLTEETGLSLGSPISPVLSNYYLCGIDGYFGKYEGITYLRYVDDMILLSRDEKSLTQAFQQLETFLADVFLELNPDKTLFTTVDKGFDYLGFRFDTHGMTATIAAERALVEMLEEVWENSHNQPKEERLLLLKQKMNGWNAYYQGRLAGGLLGVLVSIGGETFKDEEIWEYRQSLASDDLEKIQYLAEAWQSRGRLDYAVNEFALYLKLPIQNLDSDTNHQLLDLYSEYCMAFDVSIMAQIIELYTQLGCYNIAEKLSPYLMAANQKVEQPLTDGLGYQNSEIKQFRNLFIQRDDDYYLAVFVDGERRFARQEKHLTDEMIKRHLAGEITLAAYVANNAGETAMLILDIDVLKEIRLKTSEDSDAINEYEEKAHQLGLAIVSAASKIGLTAYLENTGGFGRHVWLFFKEKTEHPKMAAIGKNLIELVTQIPTGLAVELFPNGQKWREGTGGPIIKLPFGINVVSKKRSFFYGSNEARAVKWRNIFDEIHINENKFDHKPASGIKNVRKNIEESQFDDDIKRLLPLTNNVEQIISACAIMRRLALKALDTRFLNHFERLALLYVFGHLGDEGKQFLHRIMAYTMDYNKKTTEYFISKVPDLPVGCAKLKEELSFLGSSDCHCRFKVPKGCYYSPVLHAISVETFGREDGKITLPVASESRREKVSEYFSVNLRLEEKILEVMDLNKKIKALESQKTLIKEELRLTLEKAEGKTMTVETGTARIDPVSGDVEVILKI